MHTACIGSALPGMVRLDSPCCPSPGPPWQCLRGGNLGSDGGRTGGFAEERPGKAAPQFGRQWRAAIGKLIVGL